VSFALTEWFFAIKCWLIAITSSDCSACLLRGYGSSTSCQAEASTLKGFPFVVDLLAYQLIAQGAEGGK
jgi:hypothetical protein